MKNYKNFLFVVSLVLYQVVANLSCDIYLAIIPQVEKYFSINTYYVQMTIIYWFIGGVSSQLATAYYTNRYGTMKSMWIGTLIFFISTFFCGIVNDYPVFCIMRFLQGVSVTTVVITGYTTIHDNFNDTISSQLFSIIGGCLVTIPVVAPLIGAVLLKFMTWNKLFFIILVIALVSVCLLYYSIPASPRKKNNTHENNGISDFVELLRNKDFTLKSTILALLYSMSLVWIIHTPNIFVRIFHISPIDQGLIQIPIFSCYFFGGYLITFLKRIKPAISLEDFVYYGIVGMFICSIMFVLFVSSREINAKSYYSIIYMCCIYLFSSLTFGPLTRIIVNSSRKSVATTIAVYDLIMVAIATCILILSLQFIKEPKDIIYTISLLSIITAITMFYIKQNNKS